MPYWGALRKKVILKNSIKSKITSLLFCLIWITLGVTFTYIVISNFSYNIPFYFVSIAFIFLVFINIKDFISLNKIYTLENNNLINGETTITADEIDSIDFVNDNEKKIIQYVINAKKKIIIDNNKDLNLQNYINYIFDYKEKQFDLSEKNYLFKNKNILYLIFFICFFSSLVLSVLIKNPLNKINYLLYVFIFIIGFEIVKDIINLVRLKNSYFSKEELFINNKHIPYNEILKIEMADKFFISIETQKYKIKVPSKYVKYDKIVENYIQKKIK